jgi:dTDP-4-amino-4,6-dideoxygalactose transaminase
VFNTFEGGAIVSQDAKTKQRIDYLKNFGIADEITVVAPGINGKMSEFNAALGLLQLKYIDESIQKRCSIYLKYWERLATVIGVQCLGDKWLDGNNFAYFPVLITDGYPLTRDALYELLRKHGVIVRRYFYPLISEMPMYRGLTSAQHHNLLVASEAADRILCLPLYDSLDLEDQLRVCDLIAEVSHA